VISPGDAASNAVLNGFGNVFASGFLEPSGSLRHTPKVEPARTEAEDTGERDLAPIGSDDLRLRIQVLEYADSICNTVVFESKSDQPAFAAFEPSFETSIMSNPSAYDVVIVGGGPSGLSAALALGRARRRVLLFDAGPPRNARAAHLQNFVTRDGTPPAEFRRLGREQLVRYASIEVRDAHVEP